MLRTMGSNYYLRLFSALLVLYVLILSVAPLKQCHCRDSNNPTKSTKMADCPFGQLRQAAAGLTIAPVLELAVAVVPVFDSSSYIFKTSLITNFVEQACRARAPPHLLVA